MPNSSAADRGLPGWLIIIGVMTGIGPVSIDLYLPAFPLIEAAFGERGVERTMSAYLVGLAIGQLLYGPISDRFGRKPPLYFGFVVYTIGAIGCALSQNMTMLMIARVVQAFGACSGIAIGRAIVRDRCEPEQAARAFSTLMMIVSVAPILAPSGGGVIVASLGWRAAFFFQAALGAGLLLAMHLTLSESLDPKNTQPLDLSRVFKTYWMLCKDRRFIGYTFVGGCAMASLFCYVAGAPIVLTHSYSISPQRFGMLLGLNGFAFMAASRLNLRSLRFASPAVILTRVVWFPVLAGSALIVAGLFSTPLAIVIVLQFCFFFATARVMPNISALAMANHARNAGSASALLGALQSMTPIVATATLASINNGALFPLACLMTGSVLTGALLHAWTARA